MNKDLAYYMALPYPILLIPEEDGGYFARIPDLPGCMTSADSLEEVMEMLKDAKALWLEVMLEQEGVTIPEPGELLPRMPTHVKRTEPIKQA